MSNGPRADTIATGSVRRVYPDSKSGCDLHTLETMRRDRDDSMARPRPELGRNLRRLREASGLSQRELAEVADVARGTIANLERGTQMSAGLDTIEKLARALGVTSGDLIEQPFDESEAAEIHALIDQFERQERGEDPDHPPTIYAQPEEIEWLRSIPAQFWEACRPTLAAFAGFVQGYRRRKREP